MKLFTKAAVLIVASSILAACSGGGSVTPQTNSPANASPSSNGTRFKTGALTVSNSSEFKYYANPPMKLLADSNGVTPSALPPPSVCVQYYGLACYTPSEIRTAYNVPSNYDGTGQTIVIIDAFGSPTIQGDLAYFDRVMGLPAAKLNVIYPTTPPAPFDPTNGNMVGWAGETSLDVEWAHAIAPGATIDLLVAPTNSSNDILAAEGYALAKHVGNIISMSYGADEPTIPGGAGNRHLLHSDNVFQAAADSGITMIASAGDYGATNGNTTLTASFPASDPAVLSVGGTSLLMSDSGAYQSETVWNDSDPAQCPLGCALGPIAAATGGAPSSLFAAPSYQQSLFHPDSREVADVSYNAGVYTAVLVAQGFRADGKIHLYFVGGTSSGAPQWAGIIALANQANGQPLGFVNPMLYKIAKNGPYNTVFHDVTTGSNGWNGNAGEPAGLGYDMPTGLGTPNVANLITALTTGNNSGK